MNRFLNGFIYFLIAGGLFATAAIFRAKDDGSDSAFHTIWFVLNVFIFLSFIFIIDPAARLVIANEIDSFVFDEAEGILIKSRTLHAIVASIYILAGIILALVPMGEVYSGLSILFGSQFLTNAYFMILTATFLTQSNGGILVIGIVSVIVAMASLILFLAVPGGELLQSIILGLLVLATTYIVSRRGSVL